MDDLENMVKVDEIKRENSERERDFEIVVVGYDSSGYGVAGRIA